MLREMVQVVPLVMLGCCQSGSRCEQSWHADEGSILRLIVRHEHAPTGVHYGPIVTQLAAHPLDRLADVVHQSFRQLSGYRSIDAMRP
jgi:hypothetical protein